MRLSKVLSIAGATGAWVIGSGFATGQEILRFYSSYGAQSFGAVLVSYVLFTLIIACLCELGYYKGQEQDFQPYVYICGKKIAYVYSLLISVTLLLVNGLIVSGAGTTLYEAYGFNKYIASAVFSLATLLAYFWGFQKMVGLISKLGAALICCTIFIAGYSTFTNLEGFAGLSEAGALLADKQTTFSWWFSGLLYTSLIMFPGGFYFCELGKDCRSRAEAFGGAVLGVLFIMVTVLLINCGVLLNAQAVYNIDVPNVYLAGKISPLLGNAMALLLYLGMFSCCCTLLWTLCSRFYQDNPKANKRLAVGLASIAYFLGLFPFGELVGLLYPIMGACGLYFVVCVIFSFSKGAYRK